MDRPLNKLEMNEFERTFDFIDHYVGSFYHYLKEKYPDDKPSIYDIKVDGEKLPQKLIKFITGVFKDNLYEVNLRFNDTVKEEKIPSLIKYCFDNRIQPHELRCRNFKEIAISKIKVEISDYK